MSDIFLKITILSSPHRGDIIIEKRFWRELAPIGVALLYWILFIQYKPGYE